MKELNWDDLDTDPSGNYVDCPNCSSRFEVWKLLLNEDDRVCFCGLKVRTHIEVVES